MQNRQFPVKFGQNTHWQIKNTFLVEASNAARYAKFSSGTWQIYNTRTNRKKKHANNR